MADVSWKIKAREFAHCNCAYGCPCQFNALPTYGSCTAVVGLVIDQGHHGSTRLDGLKAAAVFKFPRAIHEGHGEGAVAIDERASPAQRDALLRIFSGQDTAPGGTIFQILSTVTETLHDPIFAAIEFDIDIDGRTARLRVPGLVEARGEPIRNPVTGVASRARIDLPDGFEFTTAEVGRGWPRRRARSRSTSMTPMPISANST